MATNDLPSLDSAPKPPAGFIGFWLSGCRPALRLFLRAALFALSLGLWVVMLPLSLVMAILITLLGGDGSAVLGIVPFGDPSSDAAKTHE